MKWIVTVSKSYIELVFDFATLDDLHAFLEVFFEGLDDINNVRVEITCEKESTEEGE